VSTPTLVDVADRLGKVAAQVSAAEVRLAALEAREAQTREAVRRLADAYFQGNRGRAEHTAILAALDAAPPAGSRVTPEDWAALAEIQASVAEARDIRERIEAKYNAPGCRVQVAASDNAPGASPPPAGKYAPCPKCGDRGRTIRQGVIQCETCGYPEPLTTGTGTTVVAPADPAPEAWWCPLCGGYPPCERPGHGDCRATVADPAPLPAPVADASAVTNAILGLAWAAEEVDDENEGMDLAGRADALAAWYEDARENVIAANRTVKEQRARLTAGIAAHEAAQSAEMEALRRERNGLRCRAEAQLERDRRLAADLRNVTKCRLGRDGEMCSACRQTISRAADELDGSAP